MMKNRGYIIKEAALLIHEISVDINIDLTKKTRKRLCVVPRNVCFYLLRKELKLTLEDIGSIFSKDHATVMHGLRRVDECISWKDDTSLTYQMYYTQFLNKFQELAELIIYSEGLDNTAKPEGSSYDATIERVKRQLKDSVDIYNESVKEVMEYKSRYAAQVYLFDELKAKFDKLDAEHERLKSISLFTKEDEKEIERMVNIAKNNREVYSYR